MLHLIKLCLKSISSHSESFWGKEFSHFSPILAIQKFFTSVLTFLRGEKIGLVSLKNTLHFSLH